MKITKFNILLIFILLLLFFQIYRNLKIPNTVGIIDGHFKPLKNTPNGVSTQAMNPEFKVLPLIMKDYDVFIEKENIKNIVLSYEGTKLINEKENYIHFVFTSNLFHFKDDVEFYFDSQKNTIEIKSQSRIGYGDLGANLKRYQQIKTDYNKIEQKY